MSGSNYNKYLVKVPIREVAAGLNVRGRTNPTLYLNSVSHGGLETPTG